MFKSVTSRARTVATTGLIAALVVAGVAVAQNGGHSGKANHRKAQSGKRMGPPPGGPLGMAGKDLTYGQLHVQREGKAETIRIDAGEVVSASASSLTVKENDGSEVTIAVDDETKVLAGPGRETSVADLEAGQHVIVCGPEGGAAKTVMLPPKHGRRPTGKQGSKQQGQLPPPPPGGRFGGQQGGPEGAPGQMQG